MNYKIKDDYIEVELPTGKVTKISKEDFWIIEKFPSWQDRKGYVSCERWIETEYGSVCQKVYIHKLVVGAKNNKWQVDHANRDKLDNRRSNLRMATHSQNMVNKNMSSRNKTGYRGVYLESSRSLNKKFGVTIKKKHIGRYSTAEEAAKAYDKMAKEIYGEFAVLNFPDKID